MTFPSSCCAHHLGVPTCLMPFMQVYEALDTIGLLPDTTITNAAISACDKGGQWEKAMQLFNAMDERGMKRWVMKQERSGTI